MWSVLDSGNSQPRSSADSIGDAMPTDSSSGSASAYVIDIGFDGSVDRNNLSPKDLHSYLKNHFFPKKNEVIIQEVVKGKAKKKKPLVFQLSWLDTYHTAQVLKVVSVNFVPCFRLLLVKFLIITVPFRKAGGAKGKLHTHDTLKYRDSAARVQAFMSTFQNPETNIQHYVSEQSKKQYKINFKILSSVVRAVTFCGRQNIALQGHRDRLCLKIVAISWLSFIFWQNMMMIS